MAKKRAELYKKHRPTNLDEIVGQQAAVNMLNSFIEGNRIPHFMLLHGPTGCGKTTIARILQQELDCPDADFHEINTADFRGIEEIRKIRTRMNLSPMSGNLHVWSIDEAHQLSSAAQHAFLKMLEDTPDHVYFMMLTTHPEKLLDAIRSRATEVKLDFLTPEEIEQLVSEIALAEGITLKKKVRRLLVEKSARSARKAVVLLDMVVGVKDTDEQIALIESVDEKVVAVKIAIELIYGKSPEESWRIICKVLRDMKEDAETIRYMILGFATSVLIERPSKDQQKKGLKKRESSAGAKKRAFYLIEEFSDNFYDSKLAGLAAACWRCLNKDD